MAHIRQSRPDSGLGSQAKILKTLKLLLLRAEADDVWVNKVDFHLASMRNNEQEPSDAQIVGRVLAQLHKFTADSVGSSLNDEVCVRYENDKRVWWQWEQLETFSRLLP